MGTPTPPYALLRNIIASATSSSLLTRQLTPCTRCCRPLSTHTFPARKIQWSGQRQWSSSAWRVAPAPRRDEPEAKDDGKNAAAEPPKPDERFYMSPPPGYLQQRIDAAKATAPPQSLPPEERKPVTPVPDPEKVAEPEPSTVAPETLDEASRGAPPADETAKTEAEVVAEKSVKEESVATEETLPSKHQAQRWQLSKRVQERMDELLAKAALVSHKVNNYTGTDYSGIERLRRDIIDQEQLVRAAHANVAAAKEAYTTSYSQQAASQKEVVGLLERKHSWSAADLERYMSLIRSEHLNEQAVQAAKEHLANAERDLEEARSKLEKKERKQYHEEQIWSDTIRRNSTWVTFGLMGLNIFLLLANLVIIEPWRRRRMVKEIRSALDEKTTTAPSFTPAVEAEVDKVVEPAGQTLEKLEDQVVDTVEAVAEAASEIVSEVAPDVQPEAVADTETPVGELPLAAGELLPEEAAEITEPTPESIESIEQAIEESEPRPAPENWEERLNLWKEIVSAKLVLFRSKLQDLFSERQITVKKIDVTAIALEGAAAGVAVVGFLWVLLSIR